MALSLPLLVLVMFALALLLTRILKKRRGRWAVRLERARKPHLFAELLASAWLLKIGKELRMVSWASYQLIGSPGSTLRPDHRFGICIAFGKQALPQQLSYYVSLPSERIEVFIDRTAEQDLARCLARMRLSPNLRFVVIAEKDLAARLDRAAEPRAVLRELMAALHDPVPGISGLTGPILRLTGA